MTTEEVTLDAFLVGRRTGGCTFCQDVPPELRSQIDAKVADGIRAWQAYSEWLETQGHHLSRSMVAGHYQAGHP